MTVKEKILNNIELSRDEVKELVNLYVRGGEVFPEGHFDGVEHVNNIIGENRRWSRTNLDMYEVDGRFFGLEWEEGLTENQEDEAEAQVAAEWEKIEKVVIDYIPKK